MVKKTSKEQEYITEFEETIVTVKRIERVESHHSGTEEPKEPVYEIETERKMRTLKILESNLSPEIKQVKAGDKLKYLTHRCLRYYVKEIYDMKGNKLNIDKL